MKTLLVAALAATLGAPPLMAGVATGQAIAVYRNGLAGRFGREWSNTNLEDTSLLRAASSGGSVTTPSTDA